MRITKLNDLIDEGEVVGGKWDINKKYEIRYREKAIADIYSKVGLNSDESCELSDQVMGMSNWTIRQSYRLPVWDGQSGQAEPSFLSIFERKSHILSRSGFLKTT